MTLILKLWVDFLSEVVNSSGWRVIAELASIVTRPHAAGLCASIPTARRLWDGAAGSISNWLEQIAAPVSGLISTVLNTVIRGIKWRRSGRAAGRKRSCEWLQRLSIFISPETLDWTRTEPHPASSSGNSHWGRPGQSWALEQKNNL